MIVFLFLLISLYHNVSMSSWTKKALGQVMVLKGCTNDAFKIPAHRAFAVFSRMATGAFTTCTGHRSIVVVLQNNSRCWILTNCYYPTVTSTPVLGFRALAWWICAAGSSSVAHSKVVRAAWQPKLKSSAVSQSLSACVWHFDIRKLHTFQESRSNQNR